ncbi:MAG: hypothetical protein KME01_03600 [Chroococcus sp. CMT-3BRIN-NPC107]|jgi:hypothetical protein|nr:hypothetical protein [Chroococcus sp. CMT-3BRIN-NPC107]
MSKSLNIDLSTEIAARISSKANQYFNNAYQAAILDDSYLYVQGFLVIGVEPYSVIEYGWIELEDQIIDPSIAFLKQDAENLYYFPAQTLKVKQLKAIVDESKEDYPEDDPLPIYGNAPYEYYGEIMLGGKEYLAAYGVAEAKCKELSEQNNN